MLFKEVPGQQAVKNNLIKGARGGRVSHAQLFSGAEGCGALSLALAYAQYLNCEEPVENDSCGQCNPCNKYAKLIHPDLHFSFPTVGADKTSAMFIEEWRAALLENPFMNGIQWIQRIAMENKQGNITAAETHEIIRKLSLKMFEGPYKVLIMWLPEYLGNDGNTLLKLIEEPTENTVLLFVTEDQDKILGTIQSRTQLIKLHELSEDEICGALEEKYQLAPEQATAISKIADGSFNSAISLLGETENDLHQMFREWMLGCKKSAMGEVMQMIDEMNGLGRVQLKNLLSYGLYVFRACNLYNHGVYERVIANTGDKDFIGKFSRFINTENVYTFVDEFNDAIFHIERNANPKITLLNLSLQVERLFKQ